MAGGDLVHCPVSGVAFRGKKGRFVGPVLGCLEMFGLCDSLRLRVKRGEIVRSTAIEPRISSLGPRTSINWLHIRQFCSIIKPSILLRNTEGEFTCLRKK